MTKHNNNKTKPNELIALEQNISNKIVAFSSNETKMIFKVKTAKHTPAQSFHSEAAAVQRVL